MPKKGELSKTARASLANRETRDHLTQHIDPITGEQIMLSQLFPVKVMENGRTRMVYYSKSSYKLS
ncbi:hypothetical protein ccbrp13_62880 [Ktedonobacteria bacterium brp13]|nr:hypothetical protein ccbrp13_62880 [Ktedonobacteria bacterium brp13]